MFDTNWDVDKYQNEYDSEEHWQLRRQFMLAHKQKFPEFRLVCLTQVFFNMEFLGCKYPEETMNLVNQLAGEVANEFRESRKGKLKRTFVGAQDAAGAKAKGAKPPPGSVEGTPTNKPAKNPHLDFKNEDTGVIVLDDSVDDDHEYANALTEFATHFILMIPYRATWKTKFKDLHILDYNFPNENKKIHLNGTKKDGFSCRVMVRGTEGKGKADLKLAEVYARTQAEAKEQGTTAAVERLRRYCSLVEPNPEWFTEGGAPDFIINKTPCSESPRTYLIMTKKETGHITPEVAEKLMVNFKNSSNEDMFFLDTEYNEGEKNNLMGRCQHHKLGFRHFGKDKMLQGHHVNIFKIKTAREIFEEARKRGWKHRKYIVTLKGAT